MAPPQSKQAGKAPVQPTKANPYAKPTPFRCYRCNQQGHRSNEFPQHKLLNVTGEVDDDSSNPDNVGDDDLEGAEFVEGDEGDLVVCII